MATYEVCIDTFEGPMDLLLYLVQKSELSPKDISISEITDQFLDYIKDISETDLSTAGDFLYMASRLMLLKVRELLPKDDQDELEPIEFDADKEALIQQILEYEKFKAVSDQMRIKEEESYGCFTRGRSESFKKEENKEDLSEENISLYHLYKGFLDCMKIQASESFHTIEIDDVLIEDRQQFIENYLQNHGKALFEDLLGHDQRLLNRVVTFIAILEMVKTDNIIVRQVETAGAMWVYRKKNNTSFVDEMMNDITIYTPDTDFKPGLALLLKERSKEAPKEYGIDTVLREITSRINDGDVIDEVELNRLLGVETEEEEEELEKESSLEDDNLEKATEEEDASLVAMDENESVDDGDDSAPELVPEQEEGTKMNLDINAEFEDDEDLIDEDDVEIDSESDVFEEDEDADSLMDDDDDDDEDDDSSDEDFD